MNLHVAKTLRTITDQELINIALWLASKHPDTFVALKEDIDENDNAVVINLSHKTVRLTGKQIADINNVATHTPRPDWSMEGSVPKKIAAIKYVRNDLNVGGLKDAKDVVEQLQRLGLVVYDR